MMTIYFGLQSNNLQPIDFQPPAYPPYYVTHLP